MKGRLLRANLIKYRKIVHGKCGDAILKDLLLVAPYGRARGHPFRLLIPVFLSGIKGRFFGTQYVMLWNSISISVDCIATFKRL